VPGRNLLAVELAAELAPALPAILARLRNVFDLDARPDIVDGHLAADPLLAPHVRRHPGLRLHGAFDGLELGIRAIVGQQISVRGASTLAGRVVQRFGAKMETPWPCLTHASPGAEALAEADTASIAALGMPSARATSLQALASAVGAGEIRLEPGVDPAADIEAIERLPGIGPWTAQYIAMRALRWPDAFPAADLGLVKASRLGTPKALALAAERWRPWRAYAAMHLWESLRSAG
jgi:AraC family transcriptional regulator of adaptative response / DNA-3-methyladenine glycosylase II